MMWRPSGRALFFSGIAGSGMSALALLCRHRGARVRGSDRAFDTAPDHPMRRILEAAGIDIVPQDGSGVDGADELIASTAVEADRPDMEAARRTGIPVRTRPEVLGELIREGRSVAVAGTSGKSTTAGMIAFVLRELGFAPSFVGGGRVKAFRAVDNPGNVLVGTSDVLVAEACEADTGIAGYRPAIAVIGNLALDHRSVDETAALFRSLADGTRGTVIVNADDPALAGLGISRAVTFGIGGIGGEGVVYRAEGLAPDGLGSVFVCNGVRFRLRMPGRHNVENALAVLAVVGEMGVPLHRVQEPLAAFDGIVGRFDVHHDAGDALVVHDYAHNPHKIEALVRAVRDVRPDAPVGWVFQPHGYGPTRLLKEGYREVFRQHLGPEDRLFVLPIFDAGGTTRRDVAPADLVEGIAAGSTATRAEVLARGDELPVWIVFGARDESLGGLAAEIARVKAAAKEVR